MAGHFDAAMWCNALAGVDALLAQTQAAQAARAAQAAQAPQAAQAAQAAHAAHAAQTAQTPPPKSKSQSQSQSQSPQSLLQQQLQPTRSPESGGAGPVAGTSVDPTAGPSGELTRPLLPRRAMSAPRVPLARDKPYSRRKSSTQTFTNAHELALWDSKRRSSHHGGFPSVQMTAIPMVKDYLLPPPVPVYAADNLTPPPPSPAHHGHHHPHQHAQHAQHPHHQLHMHHLHAHQLQRRAPHAPQSHAHAALEMQEMQEMQEMLALESLDSTSLADMMLGATTSASASYNGAVAEGVQGLPIQPLVMLETNANRQNQRLNSNSNGNSNSNSNRQAARTGLGGPPQGVHMQRSLSIPTLPSSAMPSGLGSSMATSMPMGVASAGELRLQTASPAPMRIPRDTHAPHLPHELSANPEPQWPQDVASNSVAPFTPYGPYPSGQCVWYYYDPDNSPMPPPPVPGPAHAAPPSHAMGATAAARPNGVHGATGANGVNGATGANSVNGISGVNAANGVSCGNGTSVQTASGSNPSPVPTATEAANPFPGALADAKGWFLLDLKTNLPFYVPFDPSDETPDPGAAAMAAKRGGLSKRANLPSPTTIQLAQAAQAAQTLQSELSAAPAVPNGGTRHSPASAQDTSPLTVLTPSEPGASPSSAPDDAPAISPALYYANPAQMSALFKRRQGALVAVSK